MLKLNSGVMARMSLFSAPGNILMKTLLVKSLADRRRCSVVAQIVFLSKHVRTLIVAG